MITGEQVKAARKLLGWSQFDLELHSRIGQSAVSAFERSERLLSEGRLERIQLAFERAGVEFPDGASPRLKMGVVKRASWDLPPER